MKVLVIDDSPISVKYTVPFKIGEIVTVIEENKSEYLLEEYRICTCGCGKEAMYFKKRFAPISDQDNLQLTEEEAEAIRKRISKPELV